jgi:hypothetical protein
VGEYQQNGKSRGEDRRVRSSAQLRRPTQGRDKSELGSSVGGSATSKKEAKAGRPEVGFQGWLFTTVKSGKSRGESEAKWEPVPHLEACRKLRNYSKVKAKKLHNHVGNAGKPATKRSNSDHKRSSTIVWVHRINETPNGLWGNLHVGYSVIHSVNR